MTESRSVAAKGSLRERIAITLICFGWFTFLSTWAVVAGGRSYDYTTAVLAENLAVEVALAAIAILVLRRRGWTREDFGFRITLDSTLSALLLLTPLVFVLASVFYRLLALAGALKGWSQFEMRMTAAPALVVLFIVVNSFFEEVFVAGYLIEASRASGTAYAVSVSALVRLLYHTYQGPAAMADVLPIGILFGLVYARWRNLWPLVLTHTAINLVAWWWSR